MVGMDVELQIAFCQEELVKNNFRVIAHSFGGASTAIEINKNLPGSVLLKTEGLGHRRFLKSSIFTTQVTEFIKK